MDGIGLDWSERWIGVALAGVASARVRRAETRTNQPTATNCAANCDQPQAAPRTVPSESETSSAANSHDSAGKLLGVCASGRGGR